MANRAAFAQGGMFKNERPGLFPMAWGARFIQPRHGQSACRFQDVQAMWIVAWHTIHFSFQHRMMLGKMEFGLRFQMTGATDLRIFARIENEFVRSAPSALGNVFAARTMAGFAARLAGHLSVCQMQPCVRTGGKCARQVDVAVRTNFVADIACTFDLQRHNRCAIHRRTGI